MTFVVDFFRVLATTMNVVMFLSPVPAIRKIVRSRSTGHMPFAPFAAMVSNAHVWMIYGWLAKNYIAIFGSCVIGVMVSVVYVTIYFHFTTERAYALKFIALFGCVIVINTLYAVLGANGLTGQSYEGVRNVVGYISIASSVIMYSSPLEKIRLVLRHKSAVFIPIQIVVVGTVNSTLWVVYSLLDTDWLVCAPTLFLLTIGLVQMALYVVFHPSKHPLPLDFTNSLHVVPVATKDAAVGSYALSPKREDKEHGFVALRSPLEPLQQV